MRLIHFLFVIVLLVPPLPVLAASPVRVHPIYLEEPHRSDYVSEAIRDRDGFLWVATDNGLKRYDGHNYRVFTRDEDNLWAIGSSEIRRLLLQSNGSLWAAGSTLNRYDAVTESFITYNTTNFNMIRALHEDSTGSFWLGGEGFGLQRFDPALGQVTGSYFEGTDNGRIYQIIRRGDSSELWVASSAGLYLFDTESHRHRSFPLDIDLRAGIEAITDMVEDDSGRLWVTTHEGLFMLDPADGSARRYLADDDNPQALQTNALWSIEKDSKGQLWIGTDKSGVHRYVAKTDSFVHYPASAHDRYRFPPGPVADIYEDREGTLWFSVGYFGMYLISPQLQKFISLQHSFEAESSLAFDNVLSMHEDRHGFIWVATDGGGLNRFDPKTHRFEHFKHDPDDQSTISSNAIIAIAEDSKGHIWLGTWSGGLNRIDPVTGNVTRIVRDPQASDGQTLADNHIFRVVVDADDRLILAVGRVGIQIYDPADGSFESYSPLDSDDPSGILSDFINAILLLPNGDFWIAGYKGLELFDARKKTFSQPNLPATLAISDLHLDEAGHIWMATSKNLSRFDPVSGETLAFSVKDGLSDEFVVSIEQDSLGFLWLGTRNGLNRFDPRTREFVVFAEDDGLAGSQFNRFSSLTTRAGLMYFGGTNGFSYFDPVAIPRNDNAPKVHITDVEINQRLQVPGQSEFLTKSVNASRELVLPSGQRDIMFKFASTNFISPHKNAYRYRLLGLESDWILTDSSRRAVRYSNLNPGEYQFQVLASNNEGVWVGSAKSLNVIVLPAWWQTHWARLSYLALLLMAMYGFSFWRLRANRRRQRQLEILVGEQTSRLKQANRSIVQLNSELEQRVAHRTKELSVEIDERRESEAKANYIAYHDTLTGLHNRAWLLKHLNELMQSRRESSAPFALLFVGGDRFRKINDTYGHLQGDQLLMAAAKRLTGLLPKDHHAVRLGSDEFTVVVDCLDSTDQAQGLAELIASEFKEPFMIDQVRMNLSVSVGFVISNDSYTEPSQVLRNANIAMQRAKDRGRGICQMFDDVILQQTLDTAALEADLKMALNRRQFSVVYQPIIVVGSGSLSGFEVLIRWRHPERGMVPPDKFIPMAESLGLIFDIGLWVLEEACNQLKVWKERFDPVILPTIAVNLSPVQLDHTDFLNRVDAVFQRTGVDRDNIKFEITESALMKHTDTVDGLLEALRERGIELAIDDFGTGYSSLSYLDKLPVQVLKVDRTFVNALTDGSGTNGSAHEIVRATIALAHNLKMRVVAEGIETQEQLQALMAYNCDYGQGYFIARPLSPEDATGFLAAATVVRLPSL